MGECSTATLERPDSPGETSRQSYDPSLDLAGRRRRKSVRQRRHYTISVAAELVSVHQQTIRHYERLGLIEPFRGKGEIRYFSPEDIDKLLQIRRLVEELGVNLAGVEVILNMRDQLNDAHADFEREMTEMREQYESEIGRLKEMIRRMQGAP